MRASIIVGAGIGICVAFAAQAQSSRQAPQPPPSSERAIIIERSPPLPIPPPRQANPPRTYQDISPPMQGPTPLAPMAPRVGG
jgi:type IV secretory pathway VirB10-like protein